MQQVGRALRPKDDPAIILDHAGNIVQHGMPDEDRTWSLEGRQKRKRDHLGVQLCPACLAANPPAVARCSVCGEELKPSADREGTAREVVAADGELEEITKELLAARRKAEEKAAKTYEDFVAIARARNYKIGWAQHRWQAKQAIIQRYARHG